MNESAADFLGEILLGRERPKVFLRESELEEENCVAGA